MNRKVALALVGATLAIALGWYFALWSPVNKHLSAARSDLSAAEAKRASAEMEQESLVQKRKLLPAEVAKAAVLDQAVPAIPGIDTMIDQVSQVGAQSGVLIGMESQSSGGSGASGISTLTLNFTVTGSYPQILDFVSRLQATPRLIKINTLGMSGGANSSASQAAAGSVAISAQVSASMFVASSALPHPPK